MNLFHDEEDTPRTEPVKGLPAMLPEGETLLWQGHPQTLSLAIHALHIRFVPVWFAVMTAWRAAEMTSRGADGAAIAQMAGTSALTCVVALVIVWGLAWAMARASVYTLTSKRIVIRHGAAIPKYINLPFAQIAGVSLRRHGRTGSLAMTLAPTGKGAPGFLHLWPHTRPMKFARPQPMLRALAEPEAVARRIAQAMGAALPETVQLAPAVVVPARDSQAGASVGNAGEGFAT